MNINYKLLDWFSYLFIYFGVFLFDPIHLFDFYSK